MCLAQGHNAVVQEPLGLESSTLPLRSLWAVEISCSVELSMKKFYDLGGQVFLQQGHIKNSIDLQQKPAL